MVATAPAAVFAEPNAALLEVYGVRKDLGKAFASSANYQAVADSPAGYLVDLEDWARQYGWKEYSSLSAYKPAVSPPSRRGTAGVPSVTSDAYILVDRASGQVLAASNADRSWPIASITKLVTADLVLAAGKSLSTVANLKSVDDVGGAKLYVNDGDTFTLDDLIYSALVGSANNAANAIARSTGDTKEVFVKKMNERAKLLNLSRTAFVDPTGIELGNVSTAREISVLATSILERKDMRRYTTTAKRTVSVLSQKTTKSITNTNWMLWKPEYDDVYVTGGKTGYLDESGWNLIVSVRPMSAKNKEVLLVLFGADSRDASFKDADALSSWAWNNYQWTSVN
jgi:D-alanyl-D-alanine endopeptidase (penicillin-binding protein 7)